MNKLRIESVNISTLQSDPDDSGHCTKKDFESIEGPLDDFLSGLLIPENIFVCAICDMPMSYRGTGRRSKTCSVKCKNKFDHFVKTSKGDYYKEKKQISCNFCSTKFETNLQNQRFCTNECRKKYQKLAKPLNKKVYFYSCVSCFMKFVRTAHLTSGGKPKGPRCYECRKELEKKRYRKNTIKRQGALSNPRISVTIIAKRDNFTCHLCRKPVDMLIPRTQQLGATIDHIKPLSKGGKDCMKNVALAHWICNIRKGSRYEI